MVASRRWDDPVAVTDLRQRTGVLFVAVMLLHVVLISAQVNSKSGVPVLEAVTFGIFSEAQRSMSGVVSGVRRVWSGYIGLRHLKQENDALKRDLAAAQIASQAVSYTHLTLPTNREV